MQNDYKNEEEFESMLGALVHAGIFPSFEEYRKNPDKWQKRPEELFESIDQSTLSHKKRLIKQKYRWKDLWECKTLEELERVYKGEGFTMDDLEMVPSIRNANGTDPKGDIEIVVSLWPKNELRAMGGVVAND